MTELSSQLHRIELPPIFPHVLKGEARLWKGMDLLEQLIRDERLSKTMTTFRAGDVAAETSREYQCTAVEGTLHDFFTWSRVETGKLRDESSFGQLPPNDGSTFVYADYKHFVELFDEGSLPEFGDWSALGLMHVDSSMCTMWLGTKCCHTPLHYDSYGYNVVVQVHGQKRWKLWKPNSLLPSAIRFPYEESSVYSSYDPLCGDLTPDFEILLSPGDILLVPKNWWHFVYTESDIALSVNAWIDEGTDTFDRVEEAIVRFSAASLCSALVHGEELDAQDLLPSGWVNPSEISEGGDSNSFLDHKMNFALLKQAMEEAHLLVNVEDKIEVSAKVKLFMNELLSPEAIRRSVIKLKDNAFPL
jgi:hypothetical protein